MSKAGEVYRPPETRNHHHALALKLTFQARWRLWAEIVNTAGDRVFVETTETPPVGDKVTVAVEAPELTQPLEITGVVQGLRPLAGAFPAGIFVKVDEASVDACSAASGTTKGPPVRTEGRREERVDCELVARLLSPIKADGCAVKSLSASGLTVHTPSSIDKDAEVELVLVLADGAELKVKAQVMWSRSELKLAGLHIIDITAQDAARLRSTVEGIIARTAAAKKVTGTVVVADDDPTILEFLTRIVMKAGFKVVRATRGDDALAMVRREKPNLVFLDVLMPGIDGLECCKAMRADAALARIPVVLLSAMGESRLVAAANQAGANDYLTKPMRLESVRALMSKYLGG